MPLNDAELRFLSHSRRARNQRVWSAFVFLRTKFIRLKAILQDRVGRDA
jgi:hypothetical protein